MIFVADFCSVPRSTESFSEPNHQTGFLFPAATRADIKAERELSTACGKHWVTLSSSTPIVPLAEKVSWEEGKMVLPKGHPVSVFVVHHRAVNRTVSLHIT